MDKVAMWRVSKLDFTSERPGSGGIDRDCCTNRLSMGLAAPAVKQLEAYRPVLLPKNAT